MDIRQCNRKRRAGTRGGFTLVEILIVVVILGILAAIVIPQFTSAAEETRHSSIKMNLHRIRTQLQIYKEHHNGQYPTLANIIDQLTMATNAAGQTATPGTSGYPFGPYLQEFPNNASTSTNDVSNGAVGSSAWYYNEETGELRANDTAESRTW